MLQGVETEIGEPRRLRMAENAEHAALVAEFIHLEIKQKISPRGARFSVESNQQQFR